MQATITPDGTPELFCRSNLTVCHITTPLVTGIVPGSVVGEPPDGGNEGTFTVTGNEPGPEVGEPRRRQ